MEPTALQLQNRELAASGQATIDSRGIDPDTLMEQLSSRLLGATDMVSSTSAGITKAIEEALSGVEKAKVATAGRIESEAGRALEELRGEQERRITAFQESQVGFATNTAALRQLQEQGEKSLRDLEQRKQELLMSNDAQSANQITQLQLQKLQFMEQAEQQYFSNLFNMAGLAIQTRAEQRASEQFEKTFQFQLDQLQYQKQKEIASIATEFGMAISPNETLESIVNKVAPLADKKRRLELEVLANKVKEDEFSLNTDAYLVDALNKFQADVTSGAISNPTRESAIVDAVTTTVAIMSAVNVKVSGEQMSKMIERAGALYDTMFAEKRASMISDNTDFARRMQGLLPWQTPRQDAGLTAIGGSATKPLPVSPTIGLNLDTMRIPTGVNAQPSILGKSLSPLDVEVNSFISNLFGM